MADLRTPALSREKLLEDFENKRRILARSLVDMRNAKIPYFDRAAEIPQELLDNCRLIQNRQRLVKLLPKHGVIAEIGTDQAVFARFMLETCLPRELHIFELDTSRIIPSNLEAGLKAKKVIIHEGQSAVNMASMPDGHFDWIYVDGDHYYEGVKLDIEAAAPKLKPGGYMIFNDYTTWSPSSMSRCGVARAVNEFCIANEWEFVYMAFQDMMYNDVAIRRKI